ncbi:DEAD-box ATP-dependent RNA helicase 57 [Cucurbita argyrosperma subsp. argyrosperma]|nr:DEAD-box ATP-dependent RNA helicase 57 [Cucurbita argyrosperma subsp. argyrosperma]
MEKGASFLFAGIHFDKKRFAADFSRFEGKKESDDVIEGLSNIANSDFEVIEDSTHSEKRKRKRKSAATESVEGFSVFKDSKLTVAASVNEENHPSENDPSEERKGFHRKLERDALFRKKYNIHVSGNNVPSPLQNFAELKTRYECDPYLLHNLVELGFKEPTPIQRQAIPVLLSGRECFACAPTGSIEEGIRAVILCPTRELASQTTRECKKLAKGKKFSIKLVTKEVIRHADFSKFSCDVLISTPLRLRLAIRKKKIDLSRVEHLVLDESDKLFELGLLKQIDTIVKACSNPSIVRSLFSATLPDFVEDLARSVMHDAVRVIVGRKNTASATVKQKLVFAGSEEGKLLALRQSFSESLNPPILIFVQSKERAKDLYGELAFENIKVNVIHSDLSEIERENVVYDFRAGKTWVLIATDVIARGMDFKGVNCVINYDFPDSASAYIHRIGRSGRAGRSGEAITFYNIGRKEIQSQTNQRMMKKKSKKHRLEGDSIQNKPKDEGDTEQQKKKSKKRKLKRDSISTKPKDDGVSKPQKKKSKKTEEA